MADKKFSQFVPAPSPATEMMRGDIAVGLRDGKNTKFDFPGLGIKDPSGNYMFQYQTVGALAVNYPQLENSSTGEPIVYGANGTDGDVGIWIKPNGSAGVRINELNWPLSDGLPGSFMATDGASNLIFTTGVTTGIVGTQHQILADGTYGVAKSGVVTLTTPQDIDITSDVAFNSLTLVDPLLVPDGGTGLRNFNTNDVLFASGPTTIGQITSIPSSIMYTDVFGVPAFCPSLTSGQIMIGSTTGFPQPANITAGTGISILNGANFISISSTGATGIIGTANEVLANGTSGSTQTGVVTLTTPQPIATTSSPTFSSLTLTNPLTLANGGTSKALTAANGGIVYSDIDSFEILAPTATARQMLQSGASTAPAWSTATWPATTTINQILYSSSANVVSGITSANSAMMYTNSSGIPAFSASMTNGQLMIGSTGGSPAPATITAGTGISISNAANSITISGTGGGTTWTEVTGTSQSMAPDNSYISSNAGLVTLTLPVTATLGSTINIVGKGAGGWLIAQNAGQSLQIGSVSSTVGVGGSVASVNRFNSIQLVCTTANTIWTTLGAPQSAGLTIV